MMRFDNCGFSAKSTLYNIRIYRSLCQEIYCTDLLCFFLKDTDKFFTDNLTFCFRLCNSCQFIIISLLCIDTDKIQIKLTIRSEYSFNFISFIFTSTAFRLLWITDLLQQKNRLLRIMPKALFHPRLSHGFL